MWSFNCFDSSFTDESDVEKNAYMSSEYKPCIFDECLPYLKPPLEVQRIHQNSLSVF